MLSNNITKPPKGSIYHKHNYNISLGVLTLVIQIMLDFENYVMKIKSKSPSLHLVRLQGKLKLRKKIYLYIRKILLYF